MRSKEDFMISRRSLIALVSAFVAGTYIEAKASPQVPFTAEAFEAAQREGKSVLVDIWASWCPTCKAQAPVIEGLVNSKKFEGLTAFRVDFDAQADVVRSLGAQQQSTLIVFKGGKEVGRSVGETDPAAIEGLLALTN
jgi:thioredoxin 1